MLILIHSFLLQVSEATHFLDSSQTAFRDSEVYYLVNRILLQLSVLIGMIGSLRIYIKWNHGEPVLGLIRGWLGAVIFILIIQQVGSIFN